MRIDTAGHHQFARCVDHRICFACRFAYRLDGLAFDQDIRQ
jgi:hypothetical protein